MRAIAVKRGCGTRTEGGIYLECGHSPFGKPLNELLIDPAMVPPSVHENGWDEYPGALVTQGASDWYAPHRTPLLFEHEGAFHVVIWVGAEFYPNVWDFIEEGRVAGFSRRVPKTFDFAKLTAASRMFYIHPQAWVDARALAETLDVDLECPYCPRGEMEPKLFHTLGGTPTCLGLTRLVDPADVALTDENTARRILACGVDYEVSGLPDGVQTTKAPGLFLQTCISGIAMINHSDGSFDESVEEKVDAAGIGIETFRTDE